MVAEGGITGIAIGGIGLVADRGLTGIGVAGLGLVSISRPMTGLLASAGSVQSESALRGISLAGGRVKSPVIRGVALAGATVRAADMAGVSVSCVNRFRDAQRGLAIGILNIARELHGVQLGLLNYAANNPPPWRLMPGVNLHLD